MFYLLKLQLSGKGLYSVWLIGVFSIQLLWSFSASWTQWKDLWAQLCAIVTLDNLDYTVYEMNKGPLKTTGYVFNKNLIMF